MIPGSRKQWEESEESGLGKKTKWSETPGIPN